MDLITTLEAATGPSRELDAEIGATIRVCHGLDLDDYVYPDKLQYVPASNGNITVYSMGDDGEYHRVYAGLAALYTASIDAAMTTVPEGWWWHISHLEASVLPAAECKDIPVSNGVLYERDGRPVKFTSHIFHNRQRVSPAICCAALKARRALLLPRPIPVGLRNSAIALLKRANPKANWASLQFEHKAHWLFAALKAREAK